MSRKIAVLVGSLRKESYSRKMALALAGLAPESILLEIVEIGGLPIYNQDDDGENPLPVFTEFRERIMSYEGVLWVTPEYNRSVPAVLKNALDIGSRPHGRNAWNGKPGGVVSISPGALGAFGANQHLRQSLVFINVPCMQQPEAYIGGVAALFDPEGGIANDKTREFLTKFMAAFADWVELHAAKQE